MTADCWALVTVCALLSDILVYLLPDYGMRFLTWPWLRHTWEIQPKGSRDQLSYYN